MTAKNIRSHLSSILPGGQAREAQLRGYGRMAEILGGPGAPKRAARIICETKNPSYRDNGTTREQITNH